ncbi:MAG: hypothetical protein HY075_02000 [Deltaproteobacteria bacterium]|nr:hypothetical protein [Deltaproteobacteria bacterium]
MSVTDRHKKPGCFRKLVNSLESTAPDRRVKIIESFKAEDPEFARYAEESVFKFEDFLNTPDNVMCELMDGMKSDMRTLAMALYHAPESMLAKFTKNMPTPQQQTFKEQSEEFQKVLAREQMAAQFRVVAKARELEDHGKLKLKKYLGNYPDA